MEFGVHLPIMAFEEHTYFLAELVRSAVSAERLFVVDVSRGEMEDEEKTFVVHMAEQKAILDIPFLVMPNLERCHLEILVPEHVPCEKTLCRRNKDAKYSSIG
jgi:hypothetical protein